jgi:hypothetical protein
MICCLSNVMIPSAVLETVRLLSLVNANPHIATDRFCLVSAHPHRTDIILSYLRLPFGSTSLTYSFKLAQHLHFIGPPPFLPTPCSKFPRLLG